MHSKWFFFRTQPIVLALMTLVTCSTADATNVIYHKAETVDGIKIPYYWDVLRSYRVVDTKHIGLKFEDSDEILIYINSETLLDTWLKHLLNGKDLNISPCERKYYSARDIYYVYEGSDWRKRSAHIGLYGCDLNHDDGHPAIAADDKDNHPLNSTPILVDKIKTGPGFQKKPLGRAFGEWPLRNRTEFENLSAKKK